MNHQSTGWPCSSLHDNPPVGRGGGGPGGGGGGGDGGDGGGGDGGDGGGGDGGAVMKK